MQTRRLILKKMLAYGAGIFPFAFFFQQKKNQEAEKRQCAYEVLKTKIPTRSSHAALFSFFSATYSDFSLTKPAEEVSLEPITYVDATRLGAPIVWHKNGSYGELCAGSVETWREFLGATQGSLTVTFGQRKACDDVYPAIMTHAVILVKDSHENYAIFGYLKDGEGTPEQKPELVNDAQLKTVLKYYSFHHELTIEGSKKQTIELLSRIEKYSQQYFNALTFNCYTPLVSGLVEAQAIGFKVPEFYNESLLVAVPRERNWGAGIVNNSYLGPLADEAVKRVMKP